MKKFKKIILFAPWFFSALVITLFPVYNHIWIKTILLFVLTSSSCFQKEMYLEGGSLKIRKKLEFGFCGILSLLSLNYVGLYFQFWPIVPFFLFLVWAEFPIVQLLLLTAGYVAFSNLWFRIPMTMDQYLILSLTVGCAVLFRQVERWKKTNLQKKLDAFQTFERKLSSGVEGLEDANHLQSKSESKVGELIQQQSKRFEEFVEMIDSVFHGHSTLIYTFDPLYEEFHLQAHKSKTQEISTQPQTLDGIFVAVRSQGTVNYFSKTEISHLPYYKKTPAIASVAAVPIYHQGLLTGVIVVDDQAQAFSKKDLEALQTISLSISNFIQDTETIYSFFRLKEELAGFYAASSALNQAFHLQNVFDVFLKTAHDIIRYDLAFLVMLDQNSKYNRIVAQFGDCESLIGETFSLAPTKGLVSWVVDNQKPLSYDSYKQRYDHSPLFHKRMKIPNLYQSLCLFPLVGKDETIGAVIFMSFKNSFFSSSTRKILEVLSMQASIAIKNAKMVRDLEQLATTDGLTGLINHRTFQRQLIHELERAKRTNIPVTLILIDLDHFKKINDNYGHPMGDFVLKEVALFLSQSVRNVDYVARYGGEEFAIILPDTSGDEALVMAQRMIARMQKKEMIDHGITLRITLSVGISTYPVDTILKEQLIDFADTALYHSKKTGRNRATLFTKNLKMVAFEEKEHRLIQRAEKILQEQQ